MSRIFFALSLVATLLLVTNIVLGLSIGDYNGLTQRMLKLTQQVRGAQLASHDAQPAPIGGAGEGSGAAKPGRGTSRLEQLEMELAEARESFEAADRLKSFHFMFGVFAGLVTLLVNAVAITYFIGTSRWCREVVDAYGLDDSPAVESTRLKRRTFPWALLGMLTMVTIAGLGAASDPTGSVSNSENWVMVHRLVAIIGTAAIAWSFLIQAGNVGRNHQLIERILDDVRRVRRERGLDTAPADDSSSQLPHPTF